MNLTKLPPIDVKALRANSRTPDGRNIIVSLTTRFSTEQTYSVPIECLKELITDLQTLNSAESATPPKPPEPIAPPQEAKDLSRVNVTVPKKWMLGSGLPQHPMVVMIFNPQTESQVGYALTVTSAREMAVGLVKYADTVAKHEANKRSLS